MKKSTARHNGRSAWGLVAIAQCMALFAFHPLAAAEPVKVYRCGPAGRTFTERPCVDGVQLEIEAQRTPEQLASAQEQALQYAIQARAIEKEHQKQQAAHKPASAGSFGSTSTPFQASGEADRGSPRQKKHRPNAAPREIRFKAIVPQPPSARH